MRAADSECYDMDYQGIAPELHRQIAQTLHDVFQLDHFRPMQQEIITSVFLHRSQLAVLPTGAGKSLCYQLPAALLPSVTVVISPLLALMKDQVDRLQALGIPAYQLSHWDSAQEQRRVMQLWEKGQLKIVFMAPERLRHPEIARRLPALGCGLLVVDEAHSISEWGHDFRPDYRRIRRFHEQIGQPPILALTATATPAVEEDILRQLGLDRASCRVTRRPIDRPNIYLGVDVVKSRTAQRAQVLERIRAEAGAVILYTDTRRQAEEWGAWLARAVAEPVAVYHAGLARDVRLAVQDGFASRRIRLVVATTAFGMGIDRSDVKGVINVGMPESIDAYSQEWGRAGRDGEPAWSSMVITASDIQGRRRMIERDRPQLAEIQEFAQRLQQLPVGRPFWWTPPLPDGDSSGDLAENHLAALEEMGQITVASKRAHEMLLTIAQPIEDWTVSALYDRMQHQFTRRLERYEAMKAYVVSTTCRRQAISGYFQQVLEQRPDMCCDYCDRQQHPEPPVPREEAGGLEDRVRQWRKARAAQDQVPSYIVFSDKVLRELCERRPQDEAQLAQCPGMGPVRTARYGADLLAMLQGEGPRARKTAPSAKEEAWLLFAEGMPLAGVALRVQRQPSTVVGYLEDWIAANETESWQWYCGSMLPADVGRHIGEACAQMPEAPLRELYDYFHGEYSFDTLRIGRAVHAKLGSAAHAGR